MFDDRWEISGRLVVVSPLHIGTGETTRYDHVKGKEEKAGSNAEGPEVAAIVRGEGRQPIIPATTIKGLLRGIAEKIGPPVVSKQVVSELFGSIKLEKAGGMGRLLPRTAVVPKGASLPNALGMPYADESALDSDRNSLGKGIFIAARTSIDAATGAAAKNKLFFQEMVAEGAEFEFKLVLVSGGAIDSDADSLLEALLACLACLGDREGLPIGGGSRAGSGRVRLKPDKLKVVSRRIDADGELQDKDETAARWTAAVKQTRLPQSAASFSINLVCDGPFLINDSSWDVEAEKNKRTDAEKDDVPQLVAQKNASGGPLLLADSLMGALRARARWLWALDRLQAGANDQEIEAIDPSAFGKTREVRKLSEASGLSPVERLFGVAGFKGLLELSGLTIGVQGIQEIYLTSVKLDRFSSAPIDNALFKTHAFLGVAVEAQFVLADRGGDAAPSADDRRLADLLFDDIKNEGLVLGHGGNKGFGWFRPA